MGMGLLHVGMGLLQMGMGLLTHGTGTFNTEEWDAKSKMQIK